MLVVYLFIVIAIRILFIWCCVSTAKRKGRDRVTAGILGFIFGLWAVIGYALVKSKKMQCPMCQSETIMRKVKKGKDIGRRFLVCKNYPICKGRIPV